MQKLSQLKVENEATKVLKRKILQHAKKEDLYGRNFKNSPYRNRRSESRAKRGLS